MTESTEDILMVLIDILMALVLISVSLLFVNSHIPMTLKIKKIVNIAVFLASGFWLLRTTESLLSASPRASL